MILANCQGFAKENTDKCSLWSRAKIKIVIDCIYKHPNMYINESNDDYLNELLDKLCKENKTMPFLGDFNINIHQIMSS